MLNYNDYFLSLYKQYINHTKVMFFHNFQMLPTLFSYATEKIKKESSFIFSFLSRLWWQRQHKSREAARCTNHPQLAWLLSNIQERWLYFFRAALV